MKILVADDSKTSLAILTASLNELGHEVIAATSGEQAIELFKNDRPDLIILDVFMNGMDGFECASQLRAINSDEWIPIIFLSAEEDEASLAKGIDAGGDDYLTKPFSKIILAAKIKAMQRLADMRKKLFEVTNQLALLSVTDPLTGLYNLRQFNQSIKEKISEAGRRQDQVALLSLDLDKFKAVNDTQGHQMGDLLLEHVAQRLKSVIRVNDFVARVGGDEFAIMINSFRDLKDVENFALKLVRHLSEPYQLNSHKTTIGVSVGIAVYPEQALTPDELIGKADIALYRAKTSGQNQVVFYSDENKFI